MAVEWYKLLTEMTRTKPYVPPPTTRIFAYTGLALYESVLPGMPSYKSMLEQLATVIVSVGTAIHIQGKVKVGLNPLAMTYALPWRKQPTILRIPLRNG